MTRTVLKIPENTHKHTNLQHSFPTGAEGAQVATLPPLPPSPLLLLVSFLSLKLMPVRAAFQTCLTCAGEEAVVNNQARYTNLRWQHLVYLKLEGQLY